MDEEEEEDDGGVMLPDSQWDIYDRLQLDARDKLCGRLVHGEQLAQTVFSLVYTAVLDGEVDVVVKV